MRRKGLGKGKGKGWKNLVNGDHYRHVLSGKGISNAVTVAKTQRKKIRAELLPLLQKRKITGYNLVDIPPELLKGTQKFRVIYGHEVTKHRDKILQELKRRNISYFVIPRESFFLDDKSFVKSPKQVRIDDIVKAGGEYQIVIDVNGKQLKQLESWLHQKTVNWETPIQFFDAFIDPTTPAWEVIPLEDSWTVPDIRIQNRQKFKRFKAVDKITKKLDKDSYLIILSAKKPNTQQVRDILKYERQDKVLVQDYKPVKHSFAHYIISKTH